MKVPSRQWMKVEQLARHIGVEGKLGNEIIEFLRSKKIRERLIQGAQAGIAPVSLISDQLLERFEPEAVRPHAVRRFLGTAVRAVLEDANYEPSGRTARLTNNPLFSTGLIYEYVAPTVVSEADAMLFRILDALTVAELKRAKVHIEQSLELQKRKR